MKGQRTIFDAIEEPEPEPTRAIPPSLGGLIGDITMVDNSIPRIGHRPGTSRARRQRPVAWLYWNPHRANEATREELIPWWRRRTGGGGEIGEDFWQALWEPGVVYAPALWRHRHELQLREVWLRVNGPLHREAPSAVRRGPVTGVYMVRAVNSQHGRPIAKRFAEELRAGALPIGARCDGIITTRTVSYKKVWNTPITADAIEQLVIALHWSSATCAAVGLALAGCRPQSPQWWVALDLAITTGQPWAEELALITNRPSGDALIRALGWVHRTGAAGLRQET